MPTALNASTTRFPHRTASGFLIIQGAVVPGTDARVFIVECTPGKRYIVKRDGGDAFPSKIGEACTESEARLLANTWWTKARDAARVHYGRTPSAPRTPRELSVPAGRYAVDDGKLGFYKVDRPTEGRWAGYVFVNQLASDTEYPVRGERRSLVLETIALNPGAASLRYGREIGACGVCGRTLTDATSRANGIGPICADKMGWS